MGLLGAVQIRLVRWWLWFKGHVERRTAEPVLWLVSFLEGFLPLVPVDPLLAAMVLADRTRWIWLSAISTFASTIGALAGYGIGYFAFDFLGTWFLEISDRSAFVEKMAMLFTDNAWAIVFAGALTPIPNSPIVVAAGFLNMGLVGFVSAWTIGRVIRFFGVAYVAYAFGMTTLSRVERALTIGTILLVLAVLSILAYTASGASRL